MIKFMKYAATIALAICLSQGVIIATETTPTPPKTAQQIKKEHIDQMKQEADAHRAQVAKQKEAHKQMDKKSKELANQRKAEDVAFRKSISDMKAKHKTELAALKASNDKVMKEKMAAQQAEIDAATKAHTEKMAKLQGEHEQQTIDTLHQHLGTSPQAH